MRDFEFWALLLLCAVVTVGIVLATGGLVVSAAAPPVEACELWRTAGGIPVYRCVDEEQYIVCYSQTPMLFCVPQQ